MYIYLNGDFINAKDASISPFDHGYLYGLGLFETFRIYDGHPFLLDDHLDRLRDSCKQLAISWDRQAEETKILLDKLISLNGWQNVYIRLNVSAGVGEVGLQTTSYEKPTELIFAKELPQKLPLVEKEGVLLSTRRNSPETKHRLKSHHFMNNILGKREVGPSVDKEGIFLTEHDELSEGVTSNLFWVSNGELFTPSLDTGCLNGITRQFIIELAKLVNINLQLGKYKKDAIINADEVFVTNSIQEIVPIVKIGDKHFPGKSGRITKLLMNQYKTHCYTLTSRRQLPERIERG